MCLGRRCLSVCLLGMLALVSLGGCGRETSIDGGGLRGSGQATDANLPFDSLIVPGVQVIDGNQQVVDRERVMRSSPAKVELRERSRSAYVHLNARAATGIDRKTFPAVIDRPAGSLELPPGEKVLRYTSADSAQVVLPDGKHDLIESLTPIAKEASPGTFAPINLELSHAAGSYLPKLSDDPVHIPVHLADSVKAPLSGVSLTPVDSEARPLAGAQGSSNGTSVLYANTQPDTDTVVKPTATGFEIDALLRSADSPTQLYFRVSAPAGATLSEEDGSVRVSDAGKTIAEIATPYAQDATGLQVPIKSSLSGDMLEVAVDGSPSEYQYPIEIDPQVGDWEFDNTSESRTNWHFITSSGATEFSAIENGRDEYGNDKGWTVNIGANHTEHEWGALAYTTQGKSAINYVRGEGTAAFAGTHVEGTLKIVSPSSTLEGNEVLTTQTEAGNTAGEWVCTPEPTCREGGGDKASSTNNSAEFLYESNRPGGGVSGTTTVKQAIVQIEEEKGPELAVDTTHELVDGGRRNVFYGSGGWLGPHAGTAFEIDYKDSGIGLSYIHDETTGVTHNFSGQDECTGGVQCIPAFNEPVLYKKGMTNGEGSLTAWAKDATGTEAETYGVYKFKVDSHPPYNYKLSGLPSNNELSDDVNYTVKGEATDGVSPTPSSGVKSIALLVDGKEVGKPNGSCPAGECTATGEWTLNVASYGSGKHLLTLVGTDNAGNVSSESFSVTVHHAAPLPLGPGRAVPLTGEYDLSNADVTVGAPPTQLTVGRSYNSRRLTAGANGPLGPQWAISLGGQESLITNPNGSVEFVGGDGRPVSFSRNERGEYESPVGDSNLKLEAHEAEKDGGITEFQLVNAAQNTVTKFAQPNGSALTPAPPTYISSFGNTGSESEILAFPDDIARDGKGNLWVTNIFSTKVQEFTEAGAYVKETTIKGIPTGLAVDSSGNVWVVDQQQKAIEEYSESGTFIKEFGSSGTGNGQFTTPESITIDPSGNLWVGDYGANRVQEFNNKGEYLRQFGSTGSGNGQFSGPWGLSSDASGNIWVVDSGNNRVEEFGSKGEYLKQFGSYGSGNGQFNGPSHVTVMPGGDLLVTDTGNQRLEIFNAKDEYATQFGTEGVAGGQFEGALGTTVNSSGDIWVDDLANDRIQKWITSAPSGSWVPVVSESPAATGTVTYAYKSVTVGGSSIIEPTEELGPKPAGVTSCPEDPTKAEKGCRELTFKYAETTTATGENESEWKEYAGRLAKISFTAYNPAAKAMETKVVAEYAYDSQGRLRAEWNPTVEKSTACGGSCPALKVAYGYDAEGHVTALTAPGLETWGFVYGTTASEPNPGRILKATQAPASAPRWNGQVTKPTEAPKLSGTAAVGNRMAVSTGTWSNSPVVYGFQWQRCNQAGKECVVIAGANNANYTPTSSDQGHTLVAVVSATNGGGSVTDPSAASALVAAGGSSYTQTIDGTSSINAISCTPGTSQCVVSDSTGKALYAKTVNTTTSSTWTSWAGPTGPSEAVACPSTGLCVLADNGNVYYAQQLGSTWVQAFAPSYKVIALSCPSASFCVDGQGESGGFIRYSTAPASTSWTSEDIDGTNNVDGVACLSSSFCAAVDNKGNSRIATSVTQVESASWTNTDIDGTTVLNGVACTSSTSCVAVDSAGNLLNLAVNSEGKATATKHNIDGTNSLTGVACTTSSICVTVDNAGNVFISKNNGETWSKLYSLSDKLTSVSCASSVLCATVDTTGKVTAFNPSATATEGEARSPQPGWTAEYQVPVSGSGAPYNMSEGEVAKWGQKSEEHPVEATAIFPPDEPQGWPASDYRRATVYYEDGEDRQVNVATPSGGVSTSEYNAQNDVVRSLSPDNRAAALKEGSKSAEVSKSLDTETEYNSEGDEVLKTLGPEHKVKLSNGSEVQAREVSHLYYDEGAPANGETYRLVTKKVNAALVAGKEEEPRTITMAYNGQENLGWKLRQPTSVTTDPGGLNLVRSTAYDPASGEVTETRPPGGSSGGGSGTWTYTSQFGSGTLAHAGGDALDNHGNVWVANDYGNLINEFSSAGTLIGTYSGWGTGSGQVEEPVSITVSSSGNVYVGDLKNNRVDEFNEKGEFIRTFGWGVSNGEAKFEICTASCKAGISGSGNGQFKGLSGIAVGLGHVWVVDSGNNRFEEFTEAGEFVKAFGSEGTGNGQFHGPTGLAASGTSIYVADEGNDRIEKFNEKGEYVSQFATKGSGNGQLSYPEGLGVDSSGNVYVADEGNNRIEEFNSSGTFVSAFGTQGSGNGQLEEVEGIVVSSTGTAYVADAGNNRIDVWSTGSGSAAHNTKTVYYSAKEEAGVVACRNHPEWVGLPCQTGPVAQPGTAGLPELPVTSLVYNIWGEPESITEAVGATTRTEAETYDPAGRLLTSTTTSSVGNSLPTVSNKYNPTNGTLEKTSDTSEGKAEALTSAYNTRGQLSSYTDADENTSTYEYDEDGRVKKINTGRGTETLKYGETTGFPEELTNEYGTTKLTFTATYDSEGKMLRESYPNAMTANYLYGPVGKLNSIEYIKNAHCNESCPEVWFKDADLPSAQGQTASQTSSLASDSYTYDNAGRLTQVKETPSGKACMARLYGYDEETNRTSETRRECSSEGGEVETHSYDSADRLTDPETEYSTFGNITKLSAADSGGYPLTSTFYTNNQVASQTQNGETVGYYLDPIGRTRQIVSTGKTAGNVTEHYTNSGGTPSWTVNVGGEVSRDIYGIGGALVAIQNNTETPVLQIANLHGDLVATASSSESVTKLSSTNNTTEFGVPTTSLPPRYSWLGSIELPTELPSGVMSMGVRSYVPQLGRFLQTDPMPGGSVNPYAYTFGDPLDTFDPTGEYVEGSYLYGFDEEENAQAIERETEREEAAKREAERLAREAEEEAAYWAGMEEWGWEEYEEWEEEWEYEYASYRHEGKVNHEGSLESGVFYRPLGEASNGLTESSTSDVISLCKNEETEGCSVQAEYSAPHTPHPPRRRRRSSHLSPSAQGTIESSQTGKQPGPDKVDEEAAGREIQKSIQQQFEDGRTGAHEGNDDDGDANIASPPARPRE